MTTIPANDHTGTASLPAHGTFQQVRGNAVPGPSIFVRCAIKVAQDDPATFHRLLTIVGNESAGYRHFAAAAFAALWGLVICVTSGFSNMSLGIALIGTAIGILTKVDRSAQNALLFDEMVNDANVADQDPQDLEGRQPPPTKTSLTNSTRRSFSSHSKRQTVLDPDGQDWPSRSISGQASKADRSKLAREHQNPAFESDESEKSDQSFIADDEIEYYVDHENQIDRSASEVEYLIKLQNPGDSE